MFQGGTRAASSCGPAVARGVRGLSASADVTTLIRAWRDGSPEAPAGLFPRVYDELKRLARGQLGRARPMHTLETTALVHEAYLKLVDQTHARWQDRAHFFAVAATAMRHLLINHARQRSASKRGGNWLKITYNEAELTAAARADTLLALDEALVDLARVDARLATIVEYRFFGGLTEQEIGSVLGVNERTVRRQWSKAKAILTRALEETNGPGPGKARPTP